MAARGAELESAILASGPNWLVAERRASSNDPRLQPRVAPERVELASGSGISATFGRTGARLVIANARVDIHLAGLSRGREVGLDRIEDAHPTVDDGAVRLRRSAEVVEWWRALPSGLEHGVTLERKPAGAGDLALRMRIDGPHEVRVADRSVTLVDDEGHTVGGYRDLVALDARGRELPARFVADGAASVEIRIDDTTAQYPIVVDPLAWSQQSVLAPATTQSTFGASVAISADGTRAIVGARNENTPFGAAYVFVRSGNTWAQEQRLTIATASSFGISVGMDGVGTRVVVGSYGEESSRGAAYVFSRASTTWSLEQRIIASDRSVDDLFGRSVAMSEDGVRVVCTSPGDADVAIGSSQGAAYVFSRSSTTWTQEQKVQATDRAQYDQLGVSVSMSGDGSRIAVGAADEWDSAGTYNYSGMVYVFSRTNTTWGQEGKLRASDPQTNAYFGTSVAISLDGTRLVAGAHQHDEAMATATTNSGAAYVFSRSNTTWSFEAKLLASDRAANDEFGSSVAMDRTGMRVVVGAHFEDDSTGGATTTNGAAYVFVRSNTSWASEQKLLSNPKASSTEVGVSMALDAAGDTAMLGSLGKAYAFDLLKTTGTGCGGGLECGTGYCVDGVCCDAPCGGNTANDCQACSAALTGGAAGTCASLQTVVASTTVCRASATTCDAAEVCKAGSTTCPADEVAAATVECRPATDLCDAPEFCNGVSATCPPAVLRANGYPCRPSVGSCDVAESCNGSSPACPANVVLGSGAPCRPAAGDCDVPETCDGAGGTCPNDVFLGTGVTCRAASSVCDLAEACSGADATCPGDVFATPGTPCRVQDGLCDFTEVCDAAGSCPIDLVRPPSYRCGIAGSVCDLDDYCDGATKVCPNETAPDDTVCDDVNVCSLSSTCQLGICTAQATLDCSDDDPCTSDLCSNPSGCSHVPVASCGDASVPTDASTQDSGTSTPTPEAAGGCSCSIAGTRSQGSGGGFGALAALAALAALVVLGASRLRARGTRADASSATRARGHRSRA